MTQPDDLADAPFPLGDYVRAQGRTGQLIAFMACSAGLKPVLDDWVPLDRLPLYLQLLERLQMSWAIDSHFSFAASDAARDVVGAHTLNTTRAFGSPPWAPAPGSVAHVFVSRSTAAVKEARKSGWYPLMLQGRVMDKPWIEHARFGELLGYPPCCRRFFAAHNDWHRDNSLYQSFRATKRASLLCNSLIKHGGLSYSWHLPCAFDCTASRQQAAAVRRHLWELSPALVARIDALVARPYLVVSEWTAYGFSGVRSAPSRVDYAACFEAPSNHDNQELTLLLRRGDAFEVRGSILCVFRREELLGTFCTRADGFAPQVPFIVEFDDVRDEP